MYCKLVLVLGLLVTLIPQISDAHLISPGKCPDLQVKQNFDVHKYMGTWYGQYSFGTESTQGKGKCVTAVYNYNDSAGLVDIYNWQIPSPGYRSSINGTSVPLDPTKKEGKMMVTFQVSEKRTKTFPLLVLDTDYETWAIVYYCKTLLKHYETSGWVLTRDQDLDNSVDKEVVEQRVDEVLKRANISRSIYTKTVQEDCKPESADLVVTEAVTEAVAEAVTEAVADAVTEAVADAVTEAVAEAVTEAVAEAVTDATTATPETTLMSETTIPFLE